MIHAEGAELANIQQMMKDVPVWDRYDLVQDSASHYVIRKKLPLANACDLDALHGNRCPGGLVFGDEAGSVLCAIRDMW